MLNTQSTKNVGTPHFSQRRVARDSPGASMATMVSKSLPAGAIRYPAAIAINYVNAATTVASAVCTHVVTVMVRCGCIITMAGTIAVHVPRLGPATPPLLHHHDQVPQLCRTRRTCRIGVQSLGTYEEGALRTCRTLCTRDYGARTTMRGGAERFKRAAHVLHTLVTRIASRVRHFIFL